MRRVFIYSLTALLALTLYASCSLDKDPLDSYSDVTEGVNQEGDRVVFRDRAAVESHLQTLYNQMRDRQEHWYLDLLLLSESHADNAYAGTTGAEVLPFESNAIEGSNSVMERDWNRYMEDIARANLLIVYVDSVNDNSLTTSLRNQYKAEAKIFRAMIMFDMVRIWGDIPIVTNVAGDISSETIEEVYDDYFPDQKTELEAYEQIEKDLLDAVADAPSNNPNDKTKFSQSVAKALLAKVYAEKPLRDYDKVIHYVDALAADGLALESDFSNLFGVIEGTADAKKRNSVETILEAQFHSGNGNWVTWMLGRDLSNYDNSFTWAKWVTPSRDLIHAFQTENDDIRFSESIVYYTTTWSNYYPSNAYPFMYKTRSAYSSIIKLRYADLLLLKAEALIQKDGGSLSEAASIIDRIRDRVELPRLTGAVKANKEALLEAYLKERRLELAFEGERWFDLVRLNRVEKVMNAVYDRDTGRMDQVYPYTENSYRLPIPQAIIDQNPEGIQQNVGY